MSSRSLGSLVVNVGADTRPLTAGLARASKQVRSFGANVGSTARSARSSFNAMGQAGGQLLGRLRGLPMLGGMLSIGGAASMVTGAITGAAGQASQYSPQVQMIHQRMQMLQRRQGMALGQKSPMASYLLSGGIFQVLGQTGVGLAGRSSLFDPSTPIGFALEHPSTALGIMGQTTFGTGPNAFAHRDSPVGQLAHAVIAEMRSVLDDISPYNTANRAQNVNPSGP